MSPASNSYRPVILELGPPAVKVEMGEVKEISFEESIGHHKECTHVAHAMYYAFDDGVIWDEFYKKAWIMMQVRFDGRFGFPGGILDEGETDDPVGGLNRELDEEMNISSIKYPTPADGGINLTQDDHVITHLRPDGRLVAHFYAREISRDTFIEMERAAMTAKEWGRETLGIFRVPLFTLEDGFSGFPVFLNNMFAGSARSQLLVTLERRKILTSDEIKHAMDASEKCKQKNDLKHNK